VNTARGALVEEDAMIEALRSGHIRRAGLDVFVREPLPAGHLLTTLENVTLSALPLSAHRKPAISSSGRRSTIAPPYRRDRPLRTSAPAVIS
jgi:D-3-phosphoglycerate dehydrogenase